jgi:predicted transcriptional regulator
LETILLAINPEYVEKIFAGTKKYEFRKRLASRAIDKILIYSTAPIMKVVGEVQIVETISSSPTALWERTKKFAGISRDKYRKYFKGCKVAYAYQLGQVIKYDPPKELQDFNISSPPQSFIYLLVEQADNEESN